MGQGSSKARTWIIVICAVLCGAYLARAPWQVYRQQRAKANDAIAEMQTDEIQRNSLMKREAELKSPIGREKLARQHGYLKKGEVPVGTESL